MRCLGSILLLGTSIPAMAAVDLPGNEVAYSQSGQFVVTGRHREPQAVRRLTYDSNFRRFVEAGWTPGSRTDLLGPPAPATNAPTLLLDPNYLVASAERLRSAFADLLDFREPHRGRVYIQLLEAASPADEITFNRVYDRPKHTWNVRVTMPAELAPERVLRVLIQALLFEVSHRGAGSAGCEIPLWLSEGLVAHVSERFGELTLFEPAQILNASYSPLSEARRLRARLGTDACFTLEQVSWPGLHADTPDIRHKFALSAHALVLELARLPDGGRALGRMIRLLPRYENWQFAFLDGFQTQFSSFLDAEKWWAIQSLLVGGRDGFEKWTFSESLKRLDEALLVPVERRAGPAEAGVREELTLREVVGTLGYEQQAAMLTRTVSGLFALELRASPHAARLVADYRTTIERYLADREAARRKDRERNRGTRQEEPVVEAMMRRLDSLAQLRQDFELLLPGDALPATAATAVLSAIQP